MYFPSLLQMETLYVEVLYTICHKIGTHGNEYSHHIEDLFAYSKTAFGVSAESHREFLERAKDVKVNEIDVNVKRSKCPEMVVETLFSSITIYFFIFFHFSLHP
jgi:hypothetical protein